MKECKLLIFVLMMFTIIGVSNASDYTLSSGNVTLCGSYNYDNFWIKSGATVFVCQWDGTGATGTIEIHAKNITIENGAIISGAGRGALGGITGADGNGTGHGHIGTGTAWGGGGAGFAGAGGTGDAAGGGGSGGAGGSAYGSASDHNLTVGSGGGSGFIGGWETGYNGGAGVLLKSALLNVYGNLSFIGNSALSTAGGGGSGGVIILDGLNVNISGVLNISGGKGGYVAPAVGAGGGSGGRIQLFYNQMLNTSDVVTDTNGGVGYPNSGAAGSLYMTSNYTTANITFFDVGYVSPVYEDTTNMFSMILKYNSSNYSNPSAHIVYNNTVYSATVENVTNDITYFSTNIDTPYISSNSNITFKWVVDITNGTGGIEEYNSTIYNQTVNKLIFGFSSTSCSSGQSLAVNFTFYKESDLTTRLNGTIGIYYTAWTNHPSITNTFSSTLTNVSQALICKTNGQDIHINARIDYNPDSYPSRSYYLYNATLTDTLQSIPLYSIETSSANYISIYVTDNIDNPIASEYVRVQKYSAGSYYTVAMGLTDPDGKVVIPLNKYDTYYKFIVLENSTIKYQSSEDTKISTDSIYIRISDLISLGSMMERFQNIIYSLTFNNVTNMFTLTYTDPSGSTTSNCLSVYRSWRNSSNTQICDTCLSTTSGTITCNVSTYTTGDFMATYYSKQNPTITIDTLAASIGSTFAKLIGKEGVFTGVFLAMVMVLLGSFSPVIAIVLLIVGLIFLTILKIMTISVGLLIVIGFIGGLIVYKMRT